MPSTNMSVALPSKPRMTGAAWPGVVCWTNTPACPRNRSGSTVGVCLSSASRPMTVTARGTSKLARSSREAVTVISGRATALRSSRADASRACCAWTWESVSIPTAKNKTSVMAERKKERKVAPLSSCQERGIPPRYSARSSWACIQAGMDYSG